MTVRVVNGWRVEPRDWCWIDIKLRLGFFILLHVDVDLCEHKYNLTLFNCRVELGS